MKAYIFDLDGTLLDSLGLWQEIDVEFLHKRGIDVPADFAQITSAMTFNQAAAYTIKRFNLPDTVESLIQEWNELAAYAYAHTVPLKPYAKEYLTALYKRGAKLAVATSLHPELMQAALRNLGIYEMFTVICTSEEAGCGKERPDIFLLAAKKMGVPPNECVVFEDILAAVKSAKSAGFTVCAVYDKANHNDWEQIKQIADYTVKDFSGPALKEL